MRITHLGHACLLVESGGRRVLIDPGSFSRDWHAIPGVDAVVVTHQHPDHVDAERLPGLLSGSPKARLVVEAALADDVSLLGLEAGDGRVEALAPGGRVDLGGLVLEGVGGRHAVIHEDIDRIGNVGVLLRAEGEPTVFHPGDAYEFAPEGVDVLAVPVVAPWASLKETVAFVRQVRPGAVVPVHDALLSPVGRALYVRQLGALGGAEVRELAGTGSTEMA
jgi:L-ascorbate metabolism protein UlaG (beta-lactamase superfamily)